MNEAANEVVGNLCSHKEEGFDFAYVCGASKGLLLSVYFFFFFL